MSADEVVKQRLADVLDRSNIPKWVDTEELRAELFKVVKRLLKAEHFATVLVETLNREHDIAFDRERGIQP
ncbi:hypothetical protein D3C77_48970 [compost metagenome]